MILSKIIPDSSIVISSALKILSPPAIDAPSRVDKFPQDGINPSAAPSVTGTTMRNSILSSQSDLGEGSRIKRDVCFSDMTSFFHATVKG